MTKETMSGNPIPNVALLYEHISGEHRLATNAEAATFALGDPDWQRVGPIDLPATTVDAALTQEPEFYTAFASQGGGFVPLPGFSNETEKGVKNLVLEHARGTGYKGTVNGYLLQQGWVVLPVFATPQPAASVASRGEAEVIAAARAVIDEFGSSMDGPLQRLYQALRTHDAATAQLQPRTPAGPSEIESLIYKFECFICHATGGKLSKHTWALATLQSAADEHLNKHVAEMVQDALAAQPRTLDAPITDAEVYSYFGAMDKKHFTKDDFEAIRQILANFAAARAATPPQPPL